MMIVGITMTALGPLALTASASLALDRLNCQASDDPDKKPCRNHSTLIYGSLGLGLALITTGVSLIVLGAKREPVATASVTPWATAEAGGLSLRLQL